MHPAFSIIFFTVTSGAGFGLIALIGLGFPMPEGPLAALLVSALAGVLAVAGLISSTLHLGHPERALYAFTQWRSSWLSREGVLAVVTMAVFGIYALMWMLTGTRVAPLGWVAALLAAATVYSTAMIYAQLRTVASWHTWLTPAVYLAFALASSLTFAVAVSPADALAGRPMWEPVALALALAWATKFLWWRRSRALEPTADGSDIGSATGLGAAGTVKLLERPHTGENYLTNEMVHRIARKHALRLRAISVVVGLAAPLGLAIAGAAGVAAILWAPAAAVLALAGLFVERWLFFAEARHTVSAYYGA